MMGLYRKPGRKLLKSKGLEQHGVGLSKIFPLGYTHSGCYKGADVRIYINCKRWMAMPILKRKLKTCQSSRFLIRGKAQGEGECGLGYYLFRHHSRFVRLHTLKWESTNQSRFSSPTWLTQSIQQACKSWKN
jgi:hypothetical protein